MRPEPGEVVGGKYRVIRPIGDGGMGIVYEAKHEVLGTPVALKFLHGELAKRPGLAQRFIQEAQVSARIQSPHVTRVTDVDQTPDGSAYLVMELLSGESLQQLLDRQLKLPRDRAVDYAIQILAGLEAAHAIGVVHRDLKPDNVFICPSTGGAMIKLLDFGIAKIRETHEYKKGLTRPGAIMGTPEYMAPEQAYSADRVDHRADLYSVGAMLYEMLTGDRPAYGEDAHAIVDQVVQGKVRRLEELDANIDGPLADIVHRALHPVADHRWGSALEMRLALARVAGELGNPGRMAAMAAAADPTHDDALTGPPPTVDEKPLSADGGGARASNVPKTLPPDEAPVATHGAEPPRGMTQEAPRDLIQKLTEQQAARATPAPMGMAPPGYTPSPYGAYAPPPAPPRRKSSKAGALVALLLGLVITGGVIAIIVFAQGGSTDEPESIPPLETAPPETTIAPAGTDTVTPPPLDPVVGPTPVAPRTNPSPVPGPAPKPPTSVGTPSTPTATSAPTATSTGTASPGIPLPPGFASAIPPGIPTTIPTFFPGIPGFGQPPSPAPAPAPAPSP